MENEEERKKGGRRRRGRGVKDKKKKEMARVGMKVTVLDEKACVLYVCMYLAGLEGSKRTCVKRHKRRYRS